MKIVATEQVGTDVFHRALVKLTGRDLGAKVSAWSRELERRKQ